MLSMRLGSELDKMKQNFPKKISDYSLDKSKIIGKGFFSEVYKVSDNEVLKVYNRPAFSSAYPVLKKLNRFELESFYKIFKFYTDDEKRLLGYIMKYYQPENIDILTMPTDFVLDNYAKMYQDMMFLAYKGISVDDLDIQNVILNKDGITIVDADNYGFYRLITRNNINALHTLFTNLFCYHLGLYHHSRNVDVQNFHDTVKRELFHSEMEPVTLARTLRKSHTPLDYINNKKR